MALEAFEYLDDLDSGNPAPDDLVSQGDDHLRGTKLTVLNHFSGDALLTRLKVAKVDRFHINDAGWWMTAPSDVAATVVQGRLLSADGNTALAIMQNVRGSETRFGSLEPDVPVLLRANATVGGNQRVLEGLAGASGYAALFYNDVETFRAADRLVTISGFRCDLQGVSGNIPRYQLSNVDHGASYTLRSDGEVRLETRLGDFTSAQTAIWFRRDGVVALGNAGEDRVTTLTTGALVERAGAVTELIVGDFTRSDNNRVEVRNSLGTAGFEVTTSGGARLQQRDAGGAAEKSWLTCDRDGPVQLNHNGANKFATEATGAVVTGVARATALPTEISHLTRKDYVDARTKVDGAANAFTGTLGDSGQMEAGLITSTLASGSVTFTNPFGAVPVVLIAQANGNPASEQNIQVTSVTTNGFSWQDQSGGANQKSWAAFGAQV